MDTNGLDKNLNNHRIICLSSDSRHYGNGFIVSPKWKNNIYSYWKVSDRISVIQLQISKVQQRYSSKLDDMKMKLMKSKQRNRTIINVYAPTSERVNTDITIHRVKKSCG